MAQTITSSSMDDIWSAVSLGVQVITAYMVYQLVSTQACVQEQDVEKTKEVICTKKEGSLELISPNDKRSVRGENVYGPYKKNTLTPWQSNRNEGREGEPVDMTKAKHWSELPCDSRDKGTPDEWIPRDGRLVRLTGRHPFNCEPPTGELAKEGFFTPPNLHIIRNHGAVPKLSWDTHIIKIGGLVPIPMKLSMDELTKKYPKTEFPVSISCCGNRRKEMNMIKQTIGFNWGTGAIGTCIYKGVLVRDILITAGIDPSDVSGKYVEFIGTDDLPNKSGGKGPFEDEPWGEKVKYGTSIPLSKVMSFADEVMIAFECNGDRLHPDRGYPCRLVIPGYIGGRMIKWLARINVLDHESHNCYHYWDNKYLPPQVTAEKAAKEGWWYKQEYIINELSLNSVITYPNHGDSLPLAKYIDKKITLKGYAHSGGGRPVTRVEISTNQGEVWDLADIHRHEQPNPYGKVWCWVWWSFEVDAAQLQDEIWVRAWDTSNSPQPERPVWTLMGQSSNHIFRVKVHIEKEDGKAVYKFEHPTQPGQQTGGWATRIADRVKSAGYGKITYLEDS